MGLAWAQTWATWATVRLTADLVGVRFGRGEAFLAVCELGAVCSGSPGIKTKGQVTELAAVTRPGVGWDEVMG
eukprot:CAMPEP_0119115838 /NCGR_PEP_ID=MMETSP1180-20130426/51961_1 /TAXON_ID=3052 ORGANISM="Chlamydomonas cf sp, Strain CCMP681" /NCGR_SAMPLE_ID=MMETSP1180 /ASSEMBLY_ACC=CAM_ASM_000741 /LENGTH=72 /DNA_ID=CAMNT_0007104935 /DNA_START=19 /DNA_END=237 /DNA_ORIENTATION=-